MSTFLKFVCSTGVVVRTEDSNLTLLVVPSSGSCQQLSHPFAVRSADLGPSRSVSQQVLSFGAPYPEGGSQARLWQGHLASVPMWTARCWALLMQVAPERDKELGTGSSSSAARVWDLSHKKFNLPWETGSLWRWPLGGQRIVFLTVFTMNLPLHTDKAWESMLSGWSKLWPDCASFLTPENRCRWGLWIVCSGFLTRRTSSHMVF